jgi:hypothetical protein
MNGQLTTEVDETFEVTTTEVSQSFDVTTSFRPILSVRIVTMAFGLSCYAAFAALYFLKPNKPVLSIGQLRFTIDALLEWVFTVMTLPGLGLAYFYGTRHHEKNPDFPVPDLLIDLLFVAAIAWVAIGNGIHLTAKLDEQILSSVPAAPLLGIKADFHWIRQVVGHVLPQIGWQVLFAALMLGQLKRPYRGHVHNAAIPCFGIVFGLMFAHGAIAGTCTHIGFMLTAISCLGFYYLGKKSKLLPEEIPILTFFFSSQVTFLLMMVGYWSIARFGSV